MAEEMVFFPVRKIKHYLNNANMGIQEIGIAIDQLNKGNIARAAFVLGRMESRLEKDYQAIRMFMDNEED